MALARRVAVDYTGPGVGLGDLLQAECAEKVELCNFTTGFKEELFPRLRAAMEHGYVFIPSSTVIREDLHRIQRHTAATGQILYRVTFLATPAAAARPFSCLDLSRKIPFDGKLRGVTLDGQ